MKCATVLTMEPSQSDRLAVSTAPRPFPGSVVIITALIAFLVGVGVTSLWFSRGRKIEVVTQQLPTEERAVVTPAIAVSDQVAGITVRIDEVTLVESGWVAVHEGSDGVLGSILGAQRFDADTHRGKIIELLRGTLPGRTYYVALRSDDGDRAFDPKKDLPLFDKSGRQAVIPFTTTATTP